MMRLFMCIAVLVLVMAPAMAGSLPHEKLSDPAQETRAQHLFTQLRCLVCQNQTITDSDARIASDLRLLVRERIRMGERDEEILSYIHSRYGDFVLMRPPMQKSTWVLWFGPLVVLCVGTAGAALILRRARHNQPDKEDAEQS